MDKIYDLLTDYGKYGALGIILAIIAVSDIPKSFFSALIKWLFERGKKDYWTKKPSRSFFIFPIVGLVEFKKTKLLRQNFLKGLIEEKKSKISQLFNEIANVKVSFQQFKSREAIEFTSNVFNVINGIPGVGKSSFLLNHLQKRYSENRLDFVFYFNNYSINKFYTGLKRKQEDVNIEQVWNTLGIFNLDYIGLSPSLLSYLLNYKYVYFVIDGVDKDEDIENILGNLNRYINKYHKSNKKIRVLVSTRIKNFQLQQLQISSFDLPPLNTDEIQKFFFSKTEDLGLGLLQNPDFGPIVDSQTSLLRFDNKLTKTPLFAEVILIILKEKGLSNIAKELHQSIASIYKLFIKVLYERGNKGINEYDIFYVLYRNLAYKTWESGNNLDVEQISNTFANSPFDIQFLIESGLLIQNDRTQTDYSFIHQTIPDILSIEALSIKNDFSYFKNKEIVREDLQTYLKDEIKNVIQYSLLLKENPSIAAILLDRPFFNKISRNEFTQATRLIVGNIFEYVIQAKNLKPSDLEGILRIFKNLSEWQGQLYKIIIDEIESLPKSESVLSILLALQLDQINDYIIRLILSDVSKNILSSLLQHNQYLQRIVEPYLIKSKTDENDRKIILFVFESEIANNTNLYKKKYTENISLKADDELLAFLSKEKIRKEIFFKGYVHTDMNHTYRINKLLSSLNFEEVFLPKGNYSCNDKTISNRKSISFSKTPHKKPLKAASLNDALLKFQSDVTYNMWNFEQFKIAYNCFTDFLGLRSMLFNDIKYEAVKENNINKVSFAYFEGNSGNSNITLSENSKQIFHQTVLWRQIQEY